MKPKVAWGGGFDELDVMEKIVDFMEQHVISYEIMILKGVCLVRNYIEQHL